MENSSGSRFSVVIALDGASGVYVGGGSAFSPGAYEDYVTIKYNAATGDTEWVRSYNGPGSDVDEVGAIGVDRSGDVYVTGSSYGGASTGSDIATIKYVQNGGVEDDRAMPVASRLSLVAEPPLVFDAEGRRVRTLAGSSACAGPNTAVWDGRDNRGRRLPLGVYVVVLDAGEKRIRVKVVLSE